MDLMDKKENLFIKLCKLENENWDQLRGFKYDHTKTPDENAARIAETWKTHRSMKHQTLYKQLVEKVKVEGEAIKKELSDIIHQNVDSSILGPILAAINGLDHVWADELEFGTTEAMVINHDHPFYRDNIFTVSLDLLKKLDEVYENKLCINCCEKEDEVGARDFERCFPISQIKSLFWRIQALELLHCAACEILVDSEPTYFEYNYQNCKSQKELEEHNKSTDELIENVAKRKQDESMAQPASDPKTEE